MLFIFFLSQVFDFSVMSGSNGVSSWILRENPNYNPWSPQRFTGKVDHTWEDMLRVKFKNFKYSLFPYQGKHGPQRGQETKDQPQNKRSQNSIKITFLSTATSEFNEALFEICFPLLRYPWSAFKPTRSLCVYDSIPSKAARLGKTACLIADSGNARD